MTTRLRFAVVGLGQCGGNLANHFAKNGYPSLAINTSMLDLKDLAHIPDNRKIHIPLNDSDGAGKDPRIGEKAVQANLSAILQAVNHLSQGADAILLAAGLGGGTGSNVAFLGGLLKRLNLPIVTLATIPTDNESALAKINALRAVNRIVSENFDSCVLIDNSKILQLFPDSSLAAFYPQANEYVVTTFCNFNSVNAEYAAKCLISFDNEDFRKVLLSKGILILGEAELNTQELRSLDDILPRLKGLWETSGLMAEGFNFATAASGAVCIFAPSEMLQATSSRFLNLLGEEFKTITNGATCYFGLYEMPPGSPIKISTMLGRLTIPVRLQELLQEASSEGQNLNRKIQQALPTLDISALEEMELFSVGPTANYAPRSSDTHVLDRDEPMAGEPQPQAMESRPMPAAEAPLEENQAYSLEEYIRLKKGRP